MLDRSKLLLLFDVDGTLTLPMKVIADEMRSFLIKEVSPRATIGIVGGSDYPKISKQMGGEEALKSFDYVFCENGLVAFEKGKQIGSESMLNFIGETLMQKFINFCFGYMSNLTLPAKRGNFVEFRAGMLNISPIGRSCSQAERDAFTQYDKEHRVREKFIEAMKEAFPDSGLKFSIGGQISVDVFPIGWDKTYCLKHLSDKGFSEIHFFGDRTTPGGNDYEIFEHPMTIGHNVTSPDDTKKQLIQLLNIPN